MNDERNKKEKNDKTERRNKSIHNQSMSGSSCLVSLSCVCEGLKYPLDVCVREPIIAPLVFISKTPEKYLIESHLPWGHIDGVHDRLSHTDINRPPEID